MRNRILRILPPALLLIAAPANPHDDLVGTRYVAASGVDAGDCDDNHAPCRTLAYALDRLQPGDAIKLATGSYDLSGLDAESLLVGKEGVRGGYSAEDHFRIQDAEANPTRIAGVPDAVRNNFIAHGFIVVDAEGEALPRIVQAKLAAPTACSAGMAGSFPCHNIDYLAQVQLEEIPTAPTSASEVWGMVDLDDGREYAFIGHRNGTTVLDVTDPALPVQVGSIPGNPSLWREVKAYQFYDPGLGRHRAYAYVTTEAPGSGLQVIDLTNLPASVSLANTLLEFSTSHTLYVSNIDYASSAALPGQTPWLFIAGANVAGGAFRIYSLADPVSPALVTAPPAGTGYMHDSTSLVITDQRTAQCANGHDPCEVLVDFNENSIDLWDVTDKAAPARLSTTTYPTASYVHSGWPTPDGRFVVVHDEGDEVRRGLNTRIYTLDIADLRAPSVVTSHIGSGKATDHNGYAVGDRYYVSHYKRGLVIFDLADPRALTEIGSFDTYLSPAANSAGTDGAWGVYPFLPSGTLLVSDVENGLFLLRRNETLPPPVVPPPAEGGGGGGGAIDALVLLMLAGSATARMRRRAGRYS